MSLSLISFLEILASFLPNFAGKQITEAELLPFGLRDFSVLKTDQFLIVVFFFCHLCFHISIIHYRQELSSNFRYNSKKHIESFQWAIHD